MGNYGIKVTEPGQGVTETSPGKYRYHSSYPLLKIKGIYTGHTYAATGAERLIAQITHSLGYAPMFDVLLGLNSVESTPTNWYPISRYIIYPVLGAWQYFKIYSDATYLYIYSYKNDGNEYVYYKAVIYYDPINP
jgi:hypothetical protein